MAGKSEMKNVAGCVIGAANNARIVNLELDIAEIKTDYKSLCKKIDDVNNNINKMFNKILGGVVVACILLALNIILEAV